MDGTQYGNMIPLIFEVKEMDRLIKNDKAREFAWKAEFIQDFKECVLKYNSSCHVLILTQQSAEYYLRPDVKELWKDQAANCNTRKRIVVVEEGGLKEYKENIAGIVEFLDNTSDIRLLLEEDISENYALYRDYGIFFDDESPKVGYFSFIRQGVKAYFTKSLGIQYKVENNAYLKRIYDQFNEVWKNEKLAEKSEQNKVRLASYLNSSET